MKSKILLTTPLILVLAVAVCLPAWAQDSELDKLKAQMETMQKTMQEMQKKISDLEAEKAKSAATAPTNGPFTTTATGEKVQFTPASKEVVGHPSQVISRDALNDQQTAAPRPNDLTLNPEYRGFIPIPNTPALIQFNAKPRLDATVDNRNSGNNDRFVTATIPVKTDPTYGGGKVFNLNARGSQLSLDVRAPDVPGDFRFYFNNDFFGSGSGMSFRVRHLYGQFYNVTAGFTYSVFEDPDVWPDTVDFEGPNSAIFARQPTVRYMIPLSENWEVNFGVQQPSSDIDTTGHADVTPVNHAPDGAVNFRWEDSKIGHVQLASIIRDVGANSPTLGNQNKFGWGINASTSLNVFDKDSVQGQLTFGHGIFHFANDNFTYTGFAGGDAAYTTGGELRTLRYTAPMVGYTHRWSDEWRSTASFGYINLQNEGSQAAAAYHETYYGSLNAVWQLRKHLSIGFEGLYGYKRENSGANGDVWRFQTGLVYSLF
jgi:hypothetical protein